jgi:hypothetical protein
VRSGTDSIESGNTDYPFISTESDFDVIMLICGAKEGNDGVSSRKIEMGQVVIIVIEDLGWRKNDSLQLWTQPVQ